jgi:3-isopropylmalate/(R)-2-methylmalate dehydratase small subunit
MSEPIKGKAWKFGDNINTDLICPGPYMRLPLKQIRQAAMAGIDPEFHQKISNGDIIVAGKNFGSGSSRELAPLALKTAGVGGVVAAYFGRIFFRNCIALGFPIIECEEAAEKIDEGDTIKIHLLSGKIINLTRQEEYTGKKLPEEFTEIFKAGGIITWIKNKGINSIR